MRRGQITIWVIAGLIVLIIILLFLIRRGTDIDVEFSDSEGTNAVKELVSNCVEDSLERLLRRAGANGGYIDTSSLRRSGEVWEADLVEFPPQDVPYWTHLRPCGNQELGCEASEQPPLCKMGSACPLGSVGDNSLEEQLEVALPAEILSCLEDFQLLDDMYEIELRRDPEADVLLTGENVVATIDMPVTITDLETEETYRLDEFSGVAEVDLGRIYGFANDIANAERNTSFLERLTLHLISVYSGLDAPLPPMRAVTVLGKKRFWSRTQVEQLLQQEILPWTNFIQISNAAASFRPIVPDDENLTEYEVALYSGIFFYLNKNVNDETYTDMRARFLYPGSRPFLKINDGKEILQPRSADVGGLLQKIVGVFMNDYRFRYTLSYPVIVTLTDESAFNGEGYDWSFAMEANIWRNEPVNRSNMTSSFILAPERVDVTSPHQRVQNTILLRTVDKEQGQRHFLSPVPHVQINYDCGESYFIGRTDENGELVTRLPYCRHGGVIRFNKAGYLGSGIEYDNYEEGVEKAFTLELWPLRNVTLTLRKRTYDQVEELRTSVPNYDSLINKSSRFNESDFGVLNIERLKDSPYDEDLPMIGFYTFSAEEQNFSAEIEAQRERLERLRNEGHLSDKDVEDWMRSLNERANQSMGPARTAVSVLLAPGEYMLDGFIMHNDIITIPEETREFCTSLKIGGNCLTGTREVTLNETNFTTWMKGGLRFPEDKPFELTWTSLYTTDELTLYMLEQKIPGSWEDLEEYETNEAYLDGFGMRILQGPVYG